MSNAEIRGRFIWHELMTSDPEAASAFYSKVLPWKTQPASTPSYTLWLAGKTGVGGLMALPASPQGGTPAWLVYIGTPDVDATVQEAEGLGASVVKPAEDIAGVGRFAVLSDPQGAVFAVFTPDPSSSGGGTAGGPGHFTWHELATSDPERATDFYAQLFGWQRGAALDLGEMGTYQLIEHGGVQIGGIHRTRPSTAPRWLSYIQVADASKAAVEAKAAGGKVVNGPVEVPDGSWIVMLTDPQGTAFAVQEPAEKAMPARKPARAVKPRPVEPPRAAAAEQEKPAMASEPVSLPEPEPSPAKVVRRPRRVARVAARKAPGRKVKVAARKAVRKPLRAKAVRKPAAKAKTVAKKRPAVRGTRATRSRLATTRGRPAGKRLAARKGARGKRR